MGNMEIFLFQPALGLCALATAGYLLSLLIKKVMLAKVSTWILAGAFVFLTVNLLLRIIQPSGLTISGYRDFFSFYAWAVGGVYLLFQLKTKTRILGAFISPIILLFMLAAAGQGAGKFLVPQNMHSWLITAHLILVIAGEALFVLASGAGAMFFIQNRLLKHRKVSRMSSLLPPLNDLDRINHFCLLTGFPVLTLGLLAGVVYAGFAWPSGWVTDPKIVSSFAVWVAYGFLLHQRMAIGWKGIRMAVMSCVVFILFLFSYLGVRFFFSTLHAFV